MKDGRVIHRRPCASLPELALIGRTEIQQPLPRLAVPFAPGCVNLYLGYKGSKQMQAEGRTYTLTAGEFFLTPPDVDHTTGPMPISRCAHYWLRLAVTLPAPFLGSVEHEPLRRRVQAMGVVHGRYGEALLSGVRQLFDICGQRTTRATTALRTIELRSHVTLVLLRLLESIDRAGDDAASDPRFARVVEHVDRHLGEDLSLHDLASVAGCSVSAVQALFKKHAGLNPGEFVTRRRMQAAEQVLLASDLPLKAIAERLGFADERHFSTAFRRFHGMPPGRFRQESAP